MYKGEIVINLYFARYFFAFAAGRDKRHSNRERESKRLDFLFLITACIIVASVMIGIPSLLFKFGFISQIER